MRGILAQGQAAQMMTIFRLLAPFAIIAGLIMGIPLYALSQAELDVKAKDIIIQGKNVELAVATEVIKERKIKLASPIRRGK